MSQLCSPCKCLFNIVHVKFTFTRRTHLIHKLTQVMTLDKQSTPTHCLWQNPHLTCLLFRQYTCPPTSTLCSKEVCCKLQSLRGFLRFLAERILVRVFPMKRASCFVSSEPQWFKQNVQKMLVSTYYWFWFLQRVSKIIQIILYYPVL